jgi:hypothetical protein
MGPPKKEDISREKTILMTSLQTHRASDVSSPELHYTYQTLPMPLRGHCVQYLAPGHSLADNFVRGEFL